jgi:hypothetical protein
MGQLARESWKKMAQGKKSRRRLPVAASREARPTLPPMTERQGREPMSEEEAVQTLVAAEARGLKQLRERLLALASGLLEWAREDEEPADLEAEPSVAAELRATIECVVTDALNPAITDLETAAGYRPDSRAAGAQTSGRQGEEVPA